MARGYLNGSGGGADVSVVTATPPDVLDGKVIVGADGEPVEGTMPNRGAVSYSLPINGSYTIGNGYHNGSGKITQSIPVQGGSTTTPGTANKTIVAANRYVNGNIVVAGSANLVPANIKRGVNIFGVTGTWEGYVGGVNDLYYRGANNANFTLETSTDGGFETGQITVKAMLIYLIATINFTGYSYLNIECYKNSPYSNQAIDVDIRENTSSGTLWANGKGPSGTGNFTVSIDISKVQAYKKWAIGVYYLGTRSEMGAIYRIWLS